MVAGLVQPIEGVSNGSDDLSPSLDLSLIASCELNWDVMDMDRPLQLKESGCEGQWGIMQLSVN
jgi:hypothetical protein